MRCPTWLRRLLGREEPLGTCPWCGQLVYASEGFYLTQRDRQMRRVYHHLECLEWVPMNVKRTALRYRRKSERRKATA